MRVVHFQRRPGSSTHSIERIFEDIRTVIDADIRVHVRENRYQSRGLWGRLADAVAALTEQGDVNHVTGDVNYLTYLLRKRCTLLTIHDCRSLERLSGFRRWLFWLLWLWIPTRRVAAITVNSQFTKHELMRYARLPGDRISVVYPAVSAEFMYSPKVLNLAEPRILQVGTADNKNVANVVRALRGIPCVLVLVGKADVRLRDTLDRNGIPYEAKAQLSREELRHEYERADLVVFVSTYEGFGMPIVEANAIGRPVVAGNVCAMPEVARDAALLVNPHDVMQIRAAIERLRADDELCRRLIEAGRRNVERFQVRDCAIRYAFIYRQLCDGCQATPRFTS